MIKRAHELFAPGPDPFVSAVLGELASIRFPVGELLDVGCANGVNASNATKLGWVVTGVDPMPHNADQTEKNIRYVQGSLPQLPFNGGTFDLVICTNVLPLLDVVTRKKSIYELMRTARSGGAVALSCIERDDDIYRGGYWNYGSLRLPFDEAGWSVRAIFEPVKRLGNESVVRSQHSVLAFKP